MTGTSALREAGLAHQLKQAARTHVAPADSDRPFASLTLLLTYRCPAMCDHCVFDSSPKNKLTLDPEIGRRAIEAIARQNPPPALSFSGGEPFLHLATMKSLAAFAFERGMISEAVTSAAWVTTSERAVQILTDLKSRGLRTLCVSYDRFHAPFVSPAKVRTAVLAALGAGLRVVMNTMSDPDSVQTSEDMLASELELDRPTIDACFVNTSTTIPVGRARHKVASYHYPAEPPRGGCAFAARTVTVSPRGDLYPCCGPVIGEDPDGAGLLIQENLAGRSVDEIADIFEALKSDLFFNLLSTVGPYGLLQELGKRDPSLPRRRYVGQCDACLEFASNPRVAAGAKALLAELAHTSVAPAGA
jgi:hypothetical protein